MSWFTDALVVLSRFKRVAFRLMAYVLVVFALALPISRVLIDQMVHDQFTVIIGNVFTRIGGDLNTTYTLFSGLNASAAAGTALAPYGYTVSLLSAAAANATATVQANFTEASVASMVVISPFEAVLLQIKLSLYIGLMATIPVVAWLLWKVAKRRLKMPKLLRSRSAATWTVLGVLLFAVGFAYTYLVMLPIFMDIMLNFGLEQGVLNTYQLSEFVNFVFITTLLFSVAFELPVLLHMVVRLGLMRIETLAYYRRHAYVLILAAAGFITADASFVTQSLIGFPMVGLYEATVQYEKLARRRARKLAVAAGDARQPAGEPSSQDGSAKGGGQ